MNLSAPFIRRPVGTILLTLGLILAGVAAFFQLPVAPLPAVDFPVILVQANLPGANSLTMASTVAAPLERHLGTIAGVNEMTSRSSMGSTQIVLQFDFARDIDGAARDVQAAINASRADLPTSLKTNPSYRKLNPAIAPIMILALTSSTRTPSQIYDAVSNLVQQKLLQVPGVGSLELGGAALPAVRVELDLTALSKFGIALEDVRTALQSVSANRPRGVLDAQGTSFQLYSLRAGLHASDYQDIVIAWRNGAAVRLRDIAKVVDGPEDLHTMGLFNGKRSVPVLISRQPGANIVETVDAIKALLPDLQRQLPSDIHLDVVSDRTLTIRASLREVEITLLIATVLVVLVVSLFLRSWRATTIPAIAVIASLAGTVALMWAARFSLDNISLMALTVATGFVVDDAIVVVENISRHIEEGMAPFRAALVGAREVGFTVVSISVSLVAVFLPLLLLGGLIGRLFFEFAATMALAVMISLVVSLTTTPMLAARLLRRDEEPARLMVWAGRAFAGVERAYARALDWALAHRRQVLLLLLGTVALNVWLIVVAPKGFFPQQDAGALMGGLRTDQSMSFNRLQSKITDVAAIVKSDPAMQNVVAFAGGTRGGGGGFLFAILKPRGTRPPINAVVARLRPRLARVGGVDLFLNPVQDLMMGGRQATSTYQYVLYADDPEVLRTYGQQLVEALRRHPDTITDVDIDQLDAGAATRVNIDRTAAARLGVSVQTIDATLYDAYGQRQVANIYSGLNQYHVVMEAAPAFNGDPAALQSLWLPVGTAPAAAPVSFAGTGGTASGGSQLAGGSAVSLTPRTMAPLGAVAQWASGATNAAISHSNGEPSATVSFNLPAGASLGKAAALIASVQAGLHAPAGLTGDFGGTAKAFQQSFVAMPLLIVAALVTIYLVLGVLYESLIHPLTALSTLPSAGVGAMIALLGSGGEFDIIALIAIFLLIGVVKKNAILIIDVALVEEREHGLAPLEAVRVASLKRFRPILMTTLAAALGALPLAIGFGDGAELRRPLGIAIFGGLVASQLLTTLTTPVVYLALNRFRRRKPGLRM